MSDFNEFRHRLTTEQTQNTLNHNLLRLNKSVLYKRQSLLEQEFVDAGIIYLPQLVCPNNDFLSYDELAKKHKLVPNNVSFINFIKMKAAIPHSWETNSNTYCQEDMPLSVEDLHEIHFPEGWTTKSAHQSLSTAKMRLLLKQQNSWQRDLGVIITENDWKAIYVNNFLSTIESKLRSFQVKLNFRAIVTNKQLHGFGLIENGTCAFCETETETFMHLFCTCTIVQCYWEDVHSWLSAFLARPIVLTDYNKLFGFPEYEDITILLNCLLLYARYIIYRGKYKGVGPNLVECLDTIREVKHTERKIAERNNNIKKFHNKWKHLCRM